jgi:hypothetical protein
MTLQFSGGGLQQGWRAALLFENGLGVRRGSAERGVRYERKPRVNDGQHFDRAPPGERTCCDIGDPSILHGDPSIARSTFNG